MELNNKIRELTDKIRREGLEKAEAEASRIKEEAKKEALQIKENAEKESARILENARREAESYAERVKADLRLSADQSLLKLRTEIHEMLLTDVLKEPLEKNMNDPHFVSSLLKNVVENWKDCNEDASLEALLPGDLHHTAEEHFRKMAGHLLNNGLHLKPSKSISGGFEIRPTNGRYKISFTDEAFEVFLKENFRPVAKTFLFGEES
jgi:V/A-type H+-transporting ATPase subunit E